MKSAFSIKFLTIVLSVFIIAGNAAAQTKPSVKLQQATVMNSSGIFVTDNYKKQSSRLTKKITKITSISYTRKLIS